MSDKLFFELVSPDRSIEPVSVDEITATGTEGEFGILPGHFPFFTSLKDGIVNYKVGNTLNEAVIGGGFLEVVDDKVILLATYLELAKEIDIDDARTKISEAETIIENNQHLNNEELHKAEKNLYLQNLRIEVAERMSHK